MFEACVFPTCPSLYGCENWLLTDPLLHFLESFQIEIDERILKLPRTQANISDLVTLGWLSMRYRTESWLSSTDFHHLTTSLSV